MRQWAEAHDKADDARFGMIWKVAGAGLMLLVALTGWSLKNQYDGMSAQLAALQETKDAIVASGQATRAQVQESAQPPPQEIRRGR